MSTPFHSSSSTTPDAPTGTSNVAIVSNIVLLSLLPNRKLPPHLCLTPSSPLESCLVIENSERFGPRAHLQTQLHLPDVVF